MSADYDISPCPFCGNSDLELEGDEYQRLYVACGNCRAKGPVAIGKGAQAVALWNNCAALFAKAVTLRQQVEKLVKLVDALSKAPPP